MKEIMLVNQYNISVQVPNGLGVMQEGKLMWLRLIDENYFEASIFLPKHNGYVNFVVNIDSEMNITPVYNSNTYTDQEVTQLKLAEQLGLKIRDTLVERRVKELGCNDNLCLER